MSLGAAATDGAAIDIRMSVVVSKEPGANSFNVVLVRSEFRHWDDDPTPDVVETTVCERAFDCSLPALFDAIATWLREGHRLRALPHSWQVSSSDGPAGREVLLVADVLPVPFCRWGWP
jgi:hypothetical protein